MLSSTITSFAFNMPWATPEQLEYLNTKALAYHATEKGSPERRKFNEELRKGWSERWPLLEQHTKVRGHRTIGYRTKHLVRCFPHISATNWADRASSQSANASQRLRSPRRPRLLRQIHPIPLLVLLSLRHRGIKIRARSRGFRAPILPMPQHLAFKTRRRLRS